ncbi:glycosyltransferase family 4 protein [Corynebacterium renale]|nr:glycosyltransferase family 4 protein [Corynebacterium renale]
MHSPRKRALPVHHVMVISHYWYPENGVPQRRWQWLSGLLTDASYRVTAIAPPPHYLRNVSTNKWWNSLRSSRNRGPESGPQGERIVRASFIPVNHSLTSKSLNQLWSALSTVRIAVGQRVRGTMERPDVVVGTVPAIPTAVAAFMVAKIWRAPLVIDLRDAWPELLDTSESWNAATGTTSRRERLLSGLPMRLVKGVVTRALNSVFKAADALIVTSEQHRQDLVARFHAPAHSVVTVRNVFPPATMPETPAAPDHARGEKPGAHLHVLYAGTIGRAQNLSNAVHAAHLAAREGVHITLRMIGAGAAKQEIMKEAGELGVDVEMLGRVTPDQLHEHYAWADTALVHLTDWPPLRKAVPSKTFELMALGMHITGVVAGEAADLIEDLGAGAVVAPESPEDLARTWACLAQDRSLLAVDERAAAWVEDEYAHRGPARFLQLIGDVIGAKGRVRG